MVWSFTYIFIPWLVDLMSIIYALQCLLIFWFLVRLLAQPLDDVRKKRVVMGIVPYFFSLVGMLYRDFWYSVWVTRLINFVYALSIAYFYYQLRKSENEKSFCISSLIIGISAMFFLVIDLLDLGEGIVIFFEIIFMLGLVGTPLYLIIESSSESPVKLGSVGGGLLLLLGLPQISALFLLLLTGIGSIGFFVFFIAVVICGELLG